MYQKLIITSIIVILMKEYIVVCQPDCPSNKTRPMEKYTEIKDGQSLVLTCCILGVSKILWFFKHATANATWESKEMKRGFYELSDENRTLTLYQAKILKDSGTFRCVGFNNLNETFMDETVVDVYIREKTFNISEWSNTEKIKFKAYSNHVIYCSIIAHKYRPCTFTWYRGNHKQNVSIISGRNLTTERTTALLVEGYEGFVDLKWKYLNSDYRKYNFSLHLMNLKESQEGQYSCFILQMKDDSNLCVSFVFEYIRNNPIYIAIGIIISFIFVFILGFIVQYDIKIIVKQFLRKLLYQDKSVGKYNFIFLYDFDDDNEVPNVFQIVKEIESRGFSTYFYHRDQQFGKDITEDVCGNIMYGDVVVIWATKNIWNNSICHFCLRILFNRLKTIKKIYVMTLNKKEVLQQCLNKEVLMDTNSCLSSNIFSWQKKSQSKSKLKYSEIWHRHNLLSWLISSLPLRCNSSHY